MKRILTAMLAGTMLFSAISCENNNIDNSNIDNSEYDKSFLESDEILEIETIPTTESKIDLRDTLLKAAKYYISNENVDVASDGSYLSYDCYSDYDIFNPDELNNVYELQFDIEVMDGIQLATLLNKELGIPESIVKRIGTTSGSDGKQTYEGEKVTLTWAYYSNEHFNLLYEVK